jgi:hypothetical protein
MNKLGLYRTLLELNSSKQDYNFFWYFIFVLKIIFIFSLSLVLFFHENILRFQFPKILVQIPFIGDLLKTIESSINVGPNLKFYFLLILIIILLLSLSKELMGSLKLLHFFILSVSSLTFFIIFPLLRGYFSKFSDIVLKYPFFTIVKPTTFDEKAAYLKTLLSGTKIGEFDISQELLEQLSFEQIHELVQKKIQINANLLSPVMAPVPNDFFTIYPIFGSFSIFSILALLGYILYNQTNYKPRLDGLSQVAETNNTRIINLENNLQTLSTSMTTQNNNKQDSIDALQGLLLLLTDRLDDALNKQNLTRNVVMEPKIVELLDSEESQTLEKLDYCLTCIILLLAEFDPMFSAFKNTEFSFTQAFNEKLNSILTGDEIEKDNEET